MKLFKSTILAMLGMAVALTSCSDDDDYIPGTPKAGVYFPNTVSSEIQILPTESSFDIRVDRVKGTPATATVTVEDPSGLFTVPSTVTFDGESLTTNLTIGYNPSELTLGETYKITVALSEGANVGLSKSDFYLTFNALLITEKFELGTGVYVYGNPWLEGLATQNAITYTYDPAKPNARTITIADWGWEEEGFANPVPFTITCEDFTPNEDGVIIVGTPEMDSGMKNGGTQPVNCMDIQSYGKVFGFNLSPEKYPYSYYDPETGTFNMTMIYYAGDKPADGSAFFIGTEIFQMDGYPDYTVSVTYNGMMTDRDGNATASCTITPGADVATVKAVLVPGEDPNLGVAAILQGAEGVVEYDYAEEIVADFAVTEGGYYSVVAVSYSPEGEPQEADYDTFRIFLGVNPDADWDDYGVVDYADGWVVPAFTLSDGTQAQPLDWMYQVAIQKHKELADTYRLVEPYGASFPLAAQNANPTRRNIVFSLPGDVVIFEPQACGFTFKGDSEEHIIGNFEGAYYSQGLTPEQIKQYVKPEYLSTYEEGQITITVPLFSGEEGFGYNWKNVPPGYIFMPEASSEVRAMTKAASIAKPKVQGLRMNSSKSKRMIVALQRNINDANTVPFRGLRGLK